MAESAEFREITEPEDLEEIIFDTSEENSEYFLKTFEKYRENPIEFFRREEYIGLRCCQTTMLLHDAGILMTPDIDGLVLEHLTLTGIEQPFRYFTLLPNNQGNGLIPIYKLVKKHLPLVSYNERANRLLREMVAAKIFSENGWNVFVTIVPDENISCNVCEAFPKMILNWMLSLKTIMLGMLSQLSSTDLNRDTVKKNKLKDISRWTLAPGDQSWFLSVLEECISNTSVPPGFQVARFSVRFGERDKRDINLQAQVNTESIRRISIHVAVTFDLSSLNMNAFWSKNGVQSLIGDRGQVWKSLCITESRNFQSNLDGRMLDVKPVLRSIARRPETLQFVQLYVDTPHMRFSGQYHPVSGSIATCGLLHWKSNKKINQCAADYIDIMEENSMKLVFPLRPRMEIVCLLTDVKDELVATDYMHLDNVVSLLNEYPLLLPVKESISSCPGAEFSQFLREGCRALVGELANVYQSSKGIGGYLPCWKAYQLECALENMFYGSTSSHLSRQTGSILLSYQLGFLTLEEPNRTTVDDNETPPLRLWTHDEEQHSRIQTVFELTNYIGSSLPVIGKAVVSLLIKDLLRNNQCMRVLIDEHALLTQLKCKDKPRWAQCVGVHTYSAVTEHILEGVYKYPLVFGRVLELLRLAKLDPVSVLCHGLKEIQIEHFPALRFTDEARHSRARWAAKAVWRISSVHCASYDGKRITDMVATELADRGLIYESKLSFVFNESIVFPWIDPVMKRLEGLGLDGNGKNEVLLYVSCVAFLMQGFYVNYQKMYLLTSPLSFSRMQSLNILSNSILSTFLKTRIYKLHMDIEYKISITTQDARSNKKLKTQDAACPLEEQCVDVHHIDTTETVLESVIKEGIVHQSGNFRGRWTAQELEIVQDLLQQDHQKHDWKELFSVYVGQCKQHNLSDRPYPAFKRKVIRMSKTFDKSA